MASACQECSIVAKLPVLRFVLPYAYGQPRFVVREDVTEDCYPTGVRSVTQRQERVHSISPQGAMFSSHCRLVGNALTERDAPESDERSRCLVYERVQRRSWRAFLPARAMPRSIAPDAWEPSSCSCRRLCFPTAPTDSMFPKRNQSKYFSFLISPPRVYLYNCDFVVSFFSLSQRSRFCRSSISICKSRCRDGCSKCYVWVSPFHRVSRPLTII